MDFLVAVTLDRILSEVLRPLGVLGDNLAETAKFKPGKRIIVF